MTRDGGASCEMAKPGNPIPNSKNAWLPSTACKSAPNKEKWIWANRKLRRTGDSCCGEQGSGSGRYRRKQSPKWVSEIRKILSNGLRGWKKWRTGDSLHVVGASQPELRDPEWKGRLAQWFSNHSPLMGSEGRLRQNLLAMQIPGPHFRPGEWETGGRAQQSEILKQAQVWEPLA